MNNLHRLTFCFDLDGTLVDTAPDLVRVLNTIIAEEGLGPTHYGLARRSVGYGAKRLITEALAREGQSIDDGRMEELFQLFLKRYADDIAQVSTPYPGVVEGLRFLKKSGARLTVCTNKPGFLARPLLDELSLSQFFENTVGGDEASRAKPSANHIWEAADHRRADEIIMVGDSYPDMRAAHAAKVASVLVTYGYSPVWAHKLKADAKIRSFRNLPSAVSKILLSRNAFRE